MAVGFASYEIARSGLQVSERGLNTTGNNIANVNTPGYTRQQTMITTGPYKNEYNYNGAYQLGLGAEVQETRQIRNIFLDNMYRQESTSYGYWETRNKTLEDVQAILGEPMGVGLQNSMNKFWDSWQELSKQPDSLTTRALVRQRGEALVYQMNNLGQQLDKLQEDLNSEIKVRIDDINDITKNIARLNVEIKKTEQTKDKANDYRDQRNLLVDKLSKLVNADAYEMQDGQITVTLGGAVLVSGGEHENLYADKNEVGSTFLVPKLQSTKMEVQIRSGTLKGLLESRGEVLGAKGSVENGSAYDKVDLVFAVNRDITPDQKADLQSNISTLVNNFKAKGIDVRLGFTEYDGTTFSPPVFAGNVPDCVTNFNGMLTAMSPYGGATDMGCEAVAAAEGLAFRSNAVKQFIVMTNSPMDETSAALGSLSDGLKANNISMSVFSSSAAVQTQLQAVAESTGGSYQSIGTAGVGATGIDTSLNSVYWKLKDDIYGNEFSSQNILPDLKNKLNLMINVMARELNSLHSSGKTLNGLNGGAFFEAIDGNYPIEMGNIKLADNITSSNGLNNIVASTSGKTGDNTIAQRIADIRSVSLIGINGKEQSIDDFYESIILNVGNDGSLAANTADSQSKLVQSADDYRQSITGVSMDEEMTSMMKFKFAYNAASKVINAIDQMIETIVSRMGVVGR